MFHGIDTNNQIHSFLNISELGESKPVFFKVESESIDHESFKFFFYHFNISVLRKSEGKVEILE